MLVKTIETDKKIIYSTTTFSFIVKLNNYNLTNKGYFDLTKIKNLRILDNGFLKFLRNKYKKTQLEMAKIVKVPARTWVGWESYKKSMPFEKLSLLSIELKLNKDFLFKLIKGAEFTYGAHHGKNRIRLPLRPEEFALVKYLIPFEQDRSYLVKSAPEKIKKYVLNNYSIDKTAFKKNGLITIYSRLLNKFLKEFYIYNKRIDINFPLTKEIKCLIKEHINLTKAVIIPLALSDGGEKSKNRLFFSGASKSIHDIWTDALFYSYNILPSSYLLPYKSIYVTTHIIPKEILIKLKKFCPNFKTSPVKQTKKSYVQLMQPSIKFLYNSSKKEQETALRLWATTEGSIGIHLDKRKGLIYPILKIACAHPILLFELQDIAKMNGIHFLIRKEDKNWSGFSGLGCSSIKGLINFLYMGGFFDVEIAKSRSKYFGGLKKQDVLLAVLEFMKKQREKDLPIFNKIKAYKEIRKIAINKEFKDANAYLNIFKKNL